MHSDVVNDVFWAEFAVQGDVLGQERRRRWRDEEKLAIVLGVGVDGASVTSVAQRHEVTRQQIYTWRHELRLKGMLLPPTGAVFLPVETAPLQTALPSEMVGEAAARGMIELHLSNGRSLRFESGLDTNTLARLIRAVEAA
ncbi:MAG: IS66-like element accessory protein TnpA [Mycobacterium sp.]